MNTTIIKADAKTRIQVMAIVSRKLNKPSRPVMTFNWFDEDTMVVSGCNIATLFSAMGERLGKKCEIVGIA